MPVRSLTSSVLKWPGRDEVVQAVVRWANSLAEADQSIRKVGYRGSYANGNWGVGSDIDLIVLVESSAHDFLERGRTYDATGLPVPADLLVYTLAEAGRRAEALDSTIWVFQRP